MPTSPVKQTEQQLSQSTTESSSSINQASDELLSQKDNQQLSQNTEQLSQKTEQLSQKSGKSLIRLENICKSFGDIRANHNISLDIHASKIKALLGENGAGKSTLMAILAGHRSKDSGNIYVDGKITSFSNEKDALSAGIGMVYQHFKLIENMSVTENIILGQAKGLISIKKLHNQVQDLAEKYSMDINVSSKIEELSMGEKQRVEILRLLYRNSKIFILDEPTAVLSPLEVDQLFITLRSMANEGKAIVFISHKMKEVLQLADEIAILRQGEIVSEFARNEVPSEEELAKRMIGHDNLIQLSAEKVPLGEVFLELQEIQKSDNNELGKEKAISFQLRQGNILGIVGVAGNGQRALVDVITGLSQADAGQVLILGEKSQDFYKKPAKKHGLVYIAEDRRAQATIANFSLHDNFILTNRHLFSHGPFISLNDSVDICQELLQNFNVKAKSIKTKASALSGGNLQKFVLGRELYREPKVIIAENPTQGLDIASCEAVWSKLLALRSSAAILLVTSDLNEALKLSDRLAVLYRGEIVEMFERSDLEKVQDIALMMAGIYKKSKIN